MYSEADLDSAVAAGVLSPDAAQALRLHVEAGRAAPVVDEEQFRLVTGFNDIFVTIAAIILLVAVAWIGGSIHAALGSAAVAVTSWLLAEYFTRTRRMALPSIVLVLAFTGGVFGMFSALLDSSGRSTVGLSDGTSGLLAAGAALVTAIATYAHWRRFKVPITVAAGVAALGGTVVALAVTAVGGPAPSSELVLGLVLATGLAVFLLAMWWDRSDRLRQTRRSDVAFWLHLLAAPMVAHPVFALLGVTSSGSMGSGGALLVLAIYIGFGLVALAIDRRALLVSALAYVLFAMTQLMREFGAIELNVALTAFVIGSALLLLSAFWSNARAFVVGLLPEAWRHDLPPTRVLSPRPAS